MAFMGSPLLVSAFFDIFPWIILLTSQSELQGYKQGPAAAT